jgi:hypothetical protein
MRNTPEPKKAPAADQIVAMEDKHRQGYLSHPATKKEFGVWEKEQAWGDE